MEHEQQETTSEFLKSFLDDVPSYKKHRVTGFIPEDLFTMLFHDEIKEHGAQTKIVSECVHAFAQAFKRKREEFPDLSAREITTKLINNIKFQWT